MVMHYAFVPESSTCQGPNLSENLGAPAADRAESQVAGESSGQSLSLLLKARQVRLPQEHDSHADKHHRNL